MLSLLLHHHCTIIAPFSYHYIFSLASVPSSLESAANDSTISRSFLAHFPIIFVTFFSPMPSIMFYHLPHPAQQQRRTHSDDESPFFLPYPHFVSLRMIRPFLDHFSIISRSFLSHFFRHCRASCFIICHTQHNNNAAPTLTMSRLFFLPYPHFVSL
jgi:hypothetical protein